MRLYLCLVLWVGLCLSGRGEFTVKQHSGDWNQYPQKAHQNGFWKQKAAEAQMDDDPALEDILLFGRDDGHYPYFDLFEYYYVIVDRETQEIEWTSRKMKSSQMLLQIEDQNQNGVGELVFKFFKDGKLSTNQRGLNLKTTWCQEAIENGKTIATSQSEWNEEESPETQVFTPTEAEIKVQAGKAQKAPYKAMIVTGQDGSHFWKGSTQALKTMMEDSGLFAVDVAQTPGWGGKMEEFHPNFSAYNLVVVNYGGTTWAEPARKDFEKYVANGGGVVIIHSSVVPMDDWKEYNKMIGLGAWNNRNEKDGPYLYWKEGHPVYDQSPGWAGHHDRQHETTIVNRATEHPILAGLTPEWKHFKDEIYCRLRGPAENLEILSTVFERGRDEPILWTVGYGKGRVFVTLLGHCGNDPDMTYSMECSGFQTTLLRGAEWAVSGKVTQGVPSDFPTKNEFKLRPQFKVPPTCVFTTNQPVRVAVITEPHGYDRENFPPLMDSFAGISWKEYKNPQAHKLFSAEGAQEADVLVFYDMCPEISEADQKALVELVRGGKSVMVLHHGLGTFNKWPEFARIAGSKYLLSPQIIDGKEYNYSSYRENVEIPIEVADREHYITQGVSDFTINDEAYGRLWQAPEIHPILKTAHPECSPNILYTHQYGKGRVVGLTLAHGKGAFSNRDYAKAFHRSLLWLGHRDQQPPQVKEPVVLAYVTSWTRILPDPNVVTHINYAFGHVTKSFDGVRIDNEERLRAIVALKEKKPSLKVMLSVGGWGSGNFSEMAATSANRKAFAADCLRVVQEFGLDGIDIDWEFPTSKAANISASPDDTQNYTLMMAELRQALGAERLLTLASQAGGGYVDFKALEPLVDFVNIMTYDMGNPPRHNAPLYRSEYVGWLSIAEGVDKHIQSGIPAYKLTLGIPFYGHGKSGIANFIDYSQIIKLGDAYSEKWDPDAMVPYLVNQEGEFVCSMENPRSIGIKCEYLKGKGMLGAMYWEYNGDDAKGSLRNAVYRGVMGEQEKK